MSNPPHPSPTPAHDSLNSHAAAKGEEIRAKYGPRLGWTQLLQLQADRALIRYPWTIQFDSGPLEPGECAHPVPCGDRPEDGYTLFVHPSFQTQLDRVAYLALYQLVLINYGPFATPDAAETFGASALGLSTDEYYQVLCELADALPPQTPNPEQGAAPTGAAQTVTSAQRV